MPGTITKPLRTAVPGKIFPDGWESLLHDRSQPSASWWVERLAALLAICGVVAASLQGFHVREWRDSAADFKVVYASGRNFLHGLPAYSISGVAKVFQDFGVVPPMHWYGHTPVYPPFTFAALAPVLALPVVPAAYVWMGLSALALALSLWAMGGMAQRQYGLRRVWRLLLIAIVAASPLVSLGLQVGNVSMVAAPLCLFAAAAMAREHRLWRAAALAFSFLLKPHLALWMIAGLLLSRDNEDRQVARHALVYLGAALLLFAAVFHGQMLLQMRDLSATLHSEITTGSLNPHNRDGLSVSAQITSLQLFLGYWIHSDAWLRALTYAALAAFCAVLLREGRRRGLPGAEPYDRLEMLTAWNTFGLLVTYHRTPAATILFLLLPFRFYRLCRRWSDAMAWALLAAMQLAGWGLSGETMKKLAGEPRWMTVADFARFRQGSSAVLLFMLLLGVDLLRQGRVARATAAETRMPVSRQPCLDGVALDRDVSEAEKAIQV